MSKNKKNAHVKRKVYKNLRVYIFELRCYETENDRLFNSFLFFFKNADYTVKYEEPKFNKSHENLFIFIPVWRLP
jgi:hypothetical protein